MHQQQMNICRQHMALQKCVLIDKDNNLPTSMPKSPRMVPGFDFNGSVAPSICRPTSTIFFPSHTYNKATTYFYSCPRLQVTCLPSKSVT